jgi:hypothetical protein
MRLVSLRSQWNLVAAEHCNSLLELVRPIEHQAAGQVGRTKKSINFLEIWSIGNLALALTDSGGNRDEAKSFAPFDALADVVSGVVDEAKLTAIRQIGEQAADLLHTNQSAFPNIAEALFFVTVLGYLVDELVARITVPNGMNFWYAFTEACLIAMRERLPEIQDIIELIALNSDDLYAALDELASDCREFIDAPDPKRPPEKRWTVATEHIADCLRTLGFELRARRGSDESSADIVFSTSNALWRWLFFYEHRDRQTELAALRVSTHDCERAAEFVLRWLRRPWGVVSFKEISYALRGIVPGDDHADVPQAFAVLVDFLQTEPEQYFADAFNIRDWDQSRMLLLRFISCRYLLYACRQRVSRVRFDSEPDGPRIKAHLLIELFITWAYGSIDGSRLDLLEDTDEIIRLLHSGDWCRELSDGSATEPAGISITARQRILAQEYLADPEAMCTLLFRFSEPGFSINEHIGLMPPERFTFLPRVPSGRH